MRVVWSLLLVGALALVGFFGAQAGGQALFGIVLPYLAMAVFLVGIAVRVVGWARSPVPFRITTTCGQERSLAWIKASPLDNPSTGLGAAARVLLEVLTFRSLFRNNRSELRDGGRFTVSADKWLWAAALAFHYSFLVVFLRHYRFFAEPVPAVVAWIQGLDGFFQVGLPVVYVTDIVLVVALGYLLWRRLADPRLRYISLPADYFPLALLLGIALSGVLLRYVSKADVVAVKELAIGLVSLHPTVPQGIDPLVFAHIFLVSVLLTYFPFSKLVHMAGVFLSPTRNLANDNRMRRHINPWNPPIVGHTYAEWEHEFHDKLVASGIPLDEE
ncbi:MAG: menaquinol oxidoreductase [Acidobacteria bacterium]|nr:MAG: menaquinol oxidoreductase [Acidobacteriota bacterium]